MEGFRTKLNASSSKAGGTKKKVEHNNNSKLSKAPKTSSRKLKSSQNVKLRLTLTVKAVTGLDSKRSFPPGSKVFVAWKRGNGKKKQGSTPPVDVVQGCALWTPPPVISFETTLRYYKHLSKFEDKTLQLSLQKHGSKDVKLEMELELGPVAGDGMVALKDLVFPAPSSSKDSLKQGRSASSTAAIMTVQFKCEWLNKKKTTEGLKNVDAKQQSDAKQQPEEEEFDLETVDDSETEWTDTNDMSDSSGSEAEDEQEADDRAKASDEDSSITGMQVWLRNLPKPSTSTTATESNSNNSNPLQPMQSPTGPGRHRLPTPQPPPPSMIAGATIAEASTQLASEEKSEERKAKEKEKDEKKQQKAANGRRTSMSSSQRKEKAKGKTKGEKSKYKELKKKYEKMKKAVETQKERMTEVQQNLVHKEEEVRALHESLLALKSSSKPDAKQQEETERQEPPPELRVEVALSASASPVSSASTSPSSSSTIELTKEENRFVPRGMQGRAIIPQNWKKPSTDASSIATSVTTAPPPLFYNEAEIAEFLKPYDEHKTIKYMFANRKRLKEGKLSKITSRRYLQDMLFQLHLEHLIPVLYSQVDDYDTLMRLTEKDLREMMTNLNNNNKAQPIVKEEEVQQLSKEIGRRWAVGEYPPPSVQRQLQKGHFQEAAAAREKEVLELRDQLARTERERNELEDRLQQVLQNLILEKTKEEQTWKKKEAMMHHQIEEAQKQVKELQQEKEDMEERNRKEKEALSLEEREKWERKEKEMQEEKEGLVRSLEKERRLLTALQEQKDMLVRHMEEKEKKLVKTANEARRERDETMGQLRQLQEELKRATEAQEQLKSSEHKDRKEREVDAAEREGRHQQEMTRMQIAKEEAEKEVAALHQKLEKIKEEAQQKVELKEKVINELEEQCKAADSEKVQLKGSLEECRRLLLLREEETEQLRNERTKTEVECKKMEQRCVDLESKLQKAQDKKKKWKEEAQTVSEREKELDMQRWKTMEQTLAKEKELKEQASELQERYRSVQQELLEVKEQTLMLSEERNQQRTNYEQELRLLRAETTLRKELEGSVYCIATTDVTTHDVPTSFTATFFNSASHDIRSPRERKKTSFSAEEALRFLKENSGSLTNSLAQDMAKQLFAALVDVLIPLLVSDNSKEEGREKGREPSAWRSLLGIVAQLLRQSVPSSNQQHRTIRGEMDEARRAALWLSFLSTFLHHLLQDDRLRPFLHSSSASDPKAWKPKAGSMRTKDREEQKQKNKEEKGRGALKEFVGELQQLMWKVYQQLLRVSFSGWLRPSLVPAILAQPSLLETLEKEKHGRSSEFETISLDDQDDGADEDHDDDEEYEEEHNEEWEDDPLAKQVTVASLPSLRVATNSKPTTTTTTTGTPTKIAGTTPERKERRKKNKAGGSAVSKRRAANTPSTIVDALDSILALLAYYGVYPSLIGQCFVDLFSCMNSVLFNAMLRNGKFCTCGNALQVKIGLSQLTSWLFENNVFMRDHALLQAKEQFAHLEEAANVLMTDKSLFLNQQNIQEAFPVLNSMQILHILDLFQPDEMAPDVVPANCRKLLCQMVEEQAAKNVASPLFLATEEDLLNH